MNEIVDTLRALVEGWRSAAKIHEANASRSFNVTGNYVAGADSSTKASVLESVARELENTLEGRLALPAWQDISTAPTNTFVLVYYDRMAYPSLNQRISRAFYRSNGEWTDAGIENVHPSMWMPLPPPPAAAQEPK